MVDASTVYLLYARRHATCAHRTLRGTRSLGVVRVSSVRVSTPSRAQWSVRVRGRPYRTTITTAGKYYARARGYFAISIVCILYITMTTEGVWAPRGSTLTEVRTHLSHAHTATQVRPGGCRLWSAHRSLSVFDRSTQTGRRTSRLLAFLCTNRLSPSNAERSPSTSRSHAIANQSASRSRPVTRSRCPSRVTPPTLRLTYPTNNSI